MMNESGTKRSSMDEENIADLTSVIAEFPNGDDHPKKLPIKKLKDTFDDVAKQNADPANEGGMKVYVRVRPSTKSDMTMNVVNETSIMAIAPEESKRAQYTKMEERLYTCHKVFGSDVDQEQLFNDVVTPLMERFINGQSCVLFAYGITNAGKTYTIQGTSKQPGILPRLVSALAERVDGCEEKSDLQLGMFEIYQDKMFDLLHRRAKLTIRDRAGQVELPDLTYHPVDSAAKTLKLVDKGSSKRSSGRTLLNSGSSRSHAVYTLTLRGEVFQIVDLAGAERNNRTKASGNQQREANNINMSLMALWRCLNAVKKKSGRDSQEMIPFRESKLTHFLFPLFARTGAAGISMIACVSPESKDYDETLPVLENASLACDIRKIAPMRKQVSHRGSTANSSKAATAAEEKIVAAEKSRASKKRDASVMSRASSVSTVSAINASEDLVKTLQERIDALEQENEQLQHFQIEREQEIRIEVCAEMTERSAMLLNQIRELQDELYDQKHDRSDHTKSVKKMRHIQRMESQAHISDDLQEVQEEMELMKTDYEREIKSLKSEVRSLQAEASDWRKKAEEAMKIATNLKDVVKQGKMGEADITNIENELNSVVAAESFDQRMKRDQRFNKHKKLAELSPKLRSGRKEGASGKKREPLSPKSSNIPDAYGEEILNELEKTTTSSMTKSRRSSDALPIAPPMSPTIMGSGPFYPKTKRTLRSQIRA